ncbi:MAG: hypothetical protein ACKOTF_15400 [Opitutaceae bacterium]
MPLPTNTHANPAATARRILALLALPVAARANPPPFAPDFASPELPATRTPRGVNARAAPTTSPRSPSCATRRY